MLKFGDGIREVHMIHAGHQMYDSFRQPLPLNIDDHANGQYVPGWHRLPNPSSLRSEARTHHRGVRDPRHSGAPRLVHI